VWKSKTRFHNGENSGQVFIFTSDARCRYVPALIREQHQQFLPWQSSYAEFVFMDVLWPDMTPELLWKAIEIYSERDRRFEARSTLIELGIAGQSLRLGKSRFGKAQVLALLSMICVHVITKAEL
jgi:hypothetical protein